VFNPPNSGCISAFERFASVFILKFVEGFETLPGRYLDELSLPQGLKPCRLQYRRFLSTN
jgi:hypothetical protein